MKQTKASILYFMGPAMLLFCLIFIYPVSRTAIMSFFSVKSVTSAASTWSWAGLDNYIKLFHTPLFITSVINIGKIWLYCGIACLGLAIVLAIILTSGLRGQKFFRAIIYMPNVIAAVAVGYMWLLYVYNAKFGLLHSLFTALGWKSMANFQWLGTDHMFLSMCIAFDVSDPKATVLEITTNNKSPKHIKNVTIKDNTLKGVNGGKAIDLYLLDNCTISGNTIEGFERPIVANSCDEQFISDTDIVTE